MGRATGSRRPSRPWVIVARLHREWRSRPRARDRAAMCGSLTAIRDVRIACGPARADPAELFHTHTEGVPWRDPVSARRLARPSRHPGHHSLAVVTFVPGLGRSNSGLPNQVTELMVLTVKTRGTHSKLMVLTVKTRGTRIKTRRSLSENSWVSQREFSAPRKSHNTLIKAPISCTFTPIVRSISALRPRTGGGKG